MVKMRSSSLEMLPLEVTWFIRVIRAAMAVLNFSTSVSSLTFLMALWKALSMSGRMPSSPQRMSCRFQ